MPDDRYFEARPARLPRADVHEDQPEPSTSPRSFTARLRASLLGTGQQWAIAERTQERQKGLFKP